MNNLANAVINDKTVRYTYIPHLNGKKAIWRNDPDIGGFTDMHDLHTFYDKIAKTPQIVTDKKDLELWAPVTFIARRRKSDVLAVYCMVYDVDCGLPFEAHKEFSKFDYIAHTSYSHTNEHNKFRIILPLKKSIKPADWKHAWAYGAEMFNVYTKASVDRVCKDSSRAYLVGGTTKERAHMYKSVINETGVRFHLDYIVPPPPAKMKRKFKTFNQEEFDNYVRATPKESDRLDVAQRVGADIVDNTARRIKCPNCGRRSVWFHINVTGPMLGARCNHLNSCSWSGSIQDL